MNRLSLFSFFQKTPQSGIEKVENFGSNPGNLAMFQYVPEHLGDKAPLVIYLHGCFQSADSTAIQTGWNKLADENKFVVIYPQQNFTNNFKKCFNWYKEKHIKRDLGEPASIKQMIDFAVDKYNMDSQKIFITGLSAGGAMTSVMLANYPETFNAGAVNAGIPFGATSNFKEALNIMKGNVIKTGDEWSKYIFDINKNYKGNYPKIVVFQGEDDPYVNKINADEIVKQYVALHQINDNPIVEEKFGGNSDITLYRFHKKSAGLPTVLYYKIHNMGHAIAINPGDRKDQGGKTANFAIDKDFHSPYWAAEFFGIIKK